MSDLDPMASSASLLTTNTTSSSFDPTKTKQVAPQGQKDYAAALSTLQSKYGLPNASSLSTPLRPPSKKSLTSAPGKPLATTPSLPNARAPIPARQGNDERAKKGHSSSPLSLLRERYRSRS